MAIKGGLRPGQLGVTLFVREPERAAEFYRHVFGADELSRHTLPKSVHGLPEGTLHSVEMKIGDAFVNVAMENPNLPKAPRLDWPRTPATAGAPTASLTVYVDDVDAVLARALAAGATLLNTKVPAVEDAYWGDRIAQFVDPVGHIWRIQTVQEEVERSELPDRLAATRARYHASHAKAQ
jgi:PhnB protein